MRSLPKWPCNANHYYYCNKHCPCHGCCCHFLVLVLALLLKPRSRHSSSYCLRVKKDTDQVEPKSLIDTAPIISVGLQEVWSHFPKTVGSFRFGFRRICQTNRNRSFHAVASSCSRATGAKTIIIATKNKLPYGNSTFGVIIEANVPQTTTVLLVLRVFSSGSLFSTNPSAF